MFYAFLLYDIFYFHINASFHRYSIQFILQKCNTTLQKSIDI
nr:MAG TPA: hypothetical protein [Caudoviricetes sp.]DAU13741.1 MAG TPA: hypothetical protein [Caudoviricetes sp.]